MTEHIKINDTAPRVEYVGDGSTLVFPAPFPFLSSASLHVWIGDTQLVEAADYSVQGVKETSGGSVTFDTPPADGESVVIYRSADVERLSDFLPGGSLRADTLNDEFDRLTLGIQEVAARLGRSLLLADQDSGTVPTPLPTATARASRVLSFDADGHPTAGPETSTLSGIESAVSTATSSATAAAASASVAADNAALVESVAALVQNIPNMATMTGDGADTTLTLPAAPVDEKALLVTLDGIVQHFSTFSVAGTTLTFSTAPPTGVAVEVRDLSSTAIINASEVSTLAAIAAAISVVGAIAANVSTVAANDSDISDVATDLNGANTIGAAITSASDAASNASAAATSETNAATSATAAASSATSAGTARTAAETAKTGAETAQAAAETSETNAETAETNAAASATAAAGSASTATAAVADAAGASARAGFRARFGKTPPALLAFYLGTVSGLTLTRATVGTAINEGGGPASNAIDAARIEHDIDTSERLGLLLEPAGTNLAKRSNDFTNAYWLMGGNVGRVGSKADPLGGTTATRITASSSGTSTGNYMREATATGGYTNGVYSFWLRRVTGTGTVKLLNTNNGTNGSDITADLTGEWKRFTHYGTAGGGGFIYFGVGVLTSGDAVDVAFAHCEADIGDVPTSSCIETVASEVTRSADIATVDLSALAGFRAAGFTLLTEVIVRATDGVIMDIGNGSTSEVALDMQSGDLHVTGADSLNITAASGLSIGDRLLVALRVQEDSVAVSVNGAIVVTNTSHTLNGDADELRLGANISGSDPMPCVIQQVAFFGPLPDTTLEAMSNV